MKINISLRDAKRGKCFVLRYCGIGWMDLLNNCHSVSAESDRKEVVSQLEAKNDKVIYRWIGRTIDL